MSSQDIQDMTVEELEEMIERLGEEISHAQDEYRRWSVEVIKNLEDRKAEIGRAETQAQPLMNIEFMKERRDDYVATIRAGSAQRCRTISSKKNQQDVLSKRLSNLRPELAFTTSNNTSLLRNGSSPDPPGASSSPNEHQAEGEPDIDANDLEQLRKELKVHDSKEIAQYFCGYNPLPGCPVVIKDELNSMYLQIRCGVCASNTAMPLHFLKGFLGMWLHIKKAANHNEWVTSLGLTIVDYMYLACIEEVLSDQEVEHIRDTPSIIPKTRNFWANQAWYADVAHHDPRMSNLEWLDTLLSEHSRTQFFIRDVNPRRNPRLVKLHMHHRHLLPPPRQVNNCLATFPTIIEGAKGKWHDLRCFRCGCNSENGVWLQGTRGFHKHIRENHLDVVQESSLWILNPRGWIIANCTTKQWTDQDRLENKIKVTKERGSLLYAPGKDRRRLKMIYRRLTTAKKLTTEERVELQEAIAAWARANAVDEDIDFEALYEELRKFRSAR